MSGHDARFSARSHSRDTITVPRWTGVSPGERSEHAGSSTTSTWVILFLPPFGSLSASPPLSVDCSRTLADWHRQDVFHSIETSCVPARSIRAVIVRKIRFPWNQRARRIENMSITARGDRAARVSCERSFSDAKQVGCTTAGRVTCSFAVSSVMDGNERLGRNNMLSHTSHLRHSRWLCLLTGSIIFSIGNSCLFVTGDTSTAKRKGKYQCQDTYVYSIAIQIYVVCKLLEFMHNLNCKCIAVFIVCLLKLYIK